MAHITSCVVYMWLTYLPLPLLLPFHGFSMSFILAFGLQRGQLLYNRAGFIFRGWLAVRYNRFLLVWGGLAFHHKHLSNTGHRPLASTPWRNIYHSLFQPIWNLQTKRELKLIIITLTVWLCCLTTLPLSFPFISVPVPSCCNYCSIVLNTTTPSPPPKHSHTSLHPPPP